MHAVLGKTGEGHAFLFLFRYSLMLCFVVFYIKDAYPKCLLRGRQTMQTDLGGISKDEIEPVIGTIRI